MLYKAQLLNDDNEIIAQVSAYSMESLEEELGKLEKAEIKYKEE